MASPELRGGAAEGTPFSSSSDGLVQVDAPLGNESLGSDPKFDQLRELVTEPFNGEIPDVIFLHSGGMGYDYKRGIWRTTSYADYQRTEHGQVTGGRLRVIAGAAVAEAIPDVPIVTNSFMDVPPEDAVSQKTLGRIVGRVIERSEQKILFETPPEVLLELVQEAQAKFPTEVPTMAEVSRTELVRRGVDPERILTEEKSFTTITQHREMIKMAVANGWTNIAVIVNEFHEDRVQDFLDQLDTLTEEGVDDSAFQQTLAEFKAMGGEVKIITAESVLRPLSHLFRGRPDGPDRHGRIHDRRGYFDRVAADPDYQHTVAMEGEGRKALRNKTYKGRIVAQHPSSELAADPDHQRAVAMKAAWLAAQEADE